MIPRHVLLVAVLSAAVPTLAPGTIAGQERTLPEPGSLSLDFAIPDGGRVGVGVSKMWSERTKVRIGVDARYQSSSRLDPREGASRNRSAWRLGVSPEVRRYLRDDGPVVPFLSPSVSFGYGSSDDSDGLELGASLSMGAEWFPVDGIGISGKAGVTSEYRSGDRDDVQTREEWRVGIFRSALIIELYF